MVYLDRDAGAVLVNGLAQHKKAPNVAVMFDPKLIRPIKTLGRNGNPVFQCHMLVRPFHKVYILAFFSPSIFKTDSSTISFSILLVVDSASPNNSLKSYGS